MREPLFAIDRTVQFPPKPRRGPHTACFLGRVMGIRFSEGDVELLTRYAAAVGRTRPAILRELVRGLREPLRALEQREGGTL
jgi:hypothetical protein